MKNLLFDENPIVVNPQLATLIGLEEAIILQQLHYWIKKSNIEAEGKMWVYNTYEEWHEQFPFISLRTLKRKINRLKELNLIEVKKLNKDKFDKTNYYTINYTELHKIAKENKRGQNDTTDEQNRPIDSAKMAQSRECQNGTADSAKMAQCINRYTETTYTETTTETNLEKTRACKNDLSNIGFLLELIKKISPKKLQEKKMAYESYFKNLIREYGFEEVKAVIEFASNDGFWIDKLIDPYSLYKNFERMKLQKNGRTKKSKGGFNKGFDEERAMSESQAFLEEMMGGDI